MSELVPLAAFADRRYVAPDRFGFAATAGWMPVNDTEYHLTAHHLPLVVRILGGVPSLGVRLDPGSLVRAPIDADGRWRGGYMPISLRTHPFALSTRPAARPIDEIDLVLGSGLIGERGAPVSVDPAAGVLGPELTAIRNTLQMMRQGAARLSLALDLLRISNVLVPLREATGGPSPDLTVDLERLSALEPSAVAALAGRSFLPLDLATALLFSRRHLRPECWPGRPVRSPEAPMARSDPMDFVLAGLETMNFALDASDLFDLGEFAFLPGEAMPPPVEATVDAPRP